MNRKITVVDQSTDNGRYSICHVLPGVIEVDFAINLNDIPF